MVLEATRVTEDFPGSLVPQEDQEDRDPQVCLDRMEGLGSLDLMGLLESLVYLAQEAMVLAITLQGNSGFFYVFLIIAHFQHPFRFNSLEP